MISTDSVLRAAFGPVNAALTPALINTVGTASAVLFTDLATTTGITSRRIRIVNTHATQQLALFVVPNGQAPASETTASLNAMIVMPGASESFVVEGPMRVLVAGSGAATTFAAVASDR